MLLLRNIMLCTLAMSLEGMKKLPTLRPSRDLKLTGANKSKKTLFTPNIPDSRKRAQPSSHPAEQPKLLSEIFDSTKSDHLNKKLRLHSINNRASNSRDHLSDMKREKEINKRRNNVFVTTSIFSCGLAEKVVRKKDSRLNQKEDLLKEPVQLLTPSDTSSRGDEEIGYPDEILDTYDDSVPRVIPLDKSLNTKSRDNQMLFTGDKMLSLWSSKPRMQASLWPGLDPTLIPKEEVGDRSLASDLFNPSDEKAQILFLQMPDKFPVLKPVNPDDTHSSDPTHQKTRKTGLASLRHLPQGSVGQVRIHESGRVSMRIGDAIFDLLNATPAAFLQELVVIDHRPGSSQGHLTHLGYLSGRMVCSPDLETLTSHPPSDKT